MTELSKIKKLIESHKTPDKEFFLNLLDDEKQTEYENERIAAVMTMLKTLYILKLKSKLMGIRAEREKQNTDADHRGENYKRVLALEAEERVIKNKIESYKPLFAEPYFARMDLEDQEGYNSYYIGKRGDEGLEIVDWRAPLARRYYQKSNVKFTINDYTYKLILRRAIRTQNGKVLDFKNEYLYLDDYLTKEEIGGREESLIFDPFLKDILKSRKEKKEICDIIETIQEKQYEIITLPEDAEFIAQGVAGSGKTMIMLHRLSYILYNNESLHPYDVLMITPSDSFNAFIDELATVLELEKVKTSTLQEYFLKLLKNLGVDIEKNIDYAQNIPEPLLKYVYSEKYVSEVRGALSRIFDGIYGMFTSSECTDTVSEIISILKLQEENYGFIKNASLRVRRCVLGEIKEKKDGGLYYTKEFRTLFNMISDVREFLELMKDERMKGYAFFYKQFLSFYKSLRGIARHGEKICNGAKSDLEKLIYAAEKEIEDFKRYKTNLPSGIVLTYAEDIIRRENLISECKAAIKNVENICEGFDLTVDFYNVLKGQENFTLIGKCENTRDIARFFYRQILKKIKIRYHMPAKKLCAFDPFAILAIFKELGVSLYPKYSFVFVDEAQDISLSEYEILKWVNDRAAFNVFGDLKQNITPHRGISDWAQLGYKTFDLKLNYRNTNEIVEYVSNRLGIEMQSIGFTGSAIKEIKPTETGKFFADKNGLRAVITSEANYEKYFKKSYNSVRESGKISKSKINLLTVYESKGLEFTAVAVAGEGMTDNEKYIAYTRALKDLAIIVNQ